MFSQASLAIVRQEFHYARFSPQQHDWVHAARASYFETALWIIPIQFSNRELFTRGNGKN